jgi:hypothetical protein
LIKHKTIFALILTGASFLASAGEPTPSELFKRLIGERDDHMATESFKNEIAPLIRKLENSRGKNELKWLHNIFRITHKTFLREYQQFASFEGMFADGKYDCLTGTSLYALIFQSLNINFKIYETSYHAFIILETASGNVMIESTDPINGFITDQNLINKKLNDYRNLKSNEFTDINKSSYDFKNKIFREISLLEIVGLLQYNAALFYYNAGNLIDSSHALAMASQHYHSERIEEFAGILIVSILNSDLSDEQKKSCLRKFKYILQHNSVALKN